MKINRLKLVGYKRLLLNNINVIEYTPESIYQLILGTNGSGKSSLLAELSPLPGQPGDYIKGGSKEIDLDHNGKSYMLVSDFNKGNKHFFYCDGENLNPGGTRQVQKDLVAEYFDVTQDIHELLTGETKFTQLGPAKRREWITKLSKADFTYAIGVFQNFKSAARDSQGALKHAKQRIVGETNKLISLNEIDEVETRYNALHEELNHLFTERDNSAKELFQSKGQFDKKMKELRDITSQLISSRPERLPDYQFGSLQDVDETLNSVLTEEKIQESLRDRMGKEFNELQHLLGGLKDNQVEDFVGLKEEYDRLTVTNHNLKGKLQFYPDINASATQAFRSLQEVSATLYQLFNELPPNIDKSGDYLYSKSRIQDVKERLPKVHAECRKINSLIERDQSELNHLASVKEIECPKCELRWTPGVSDEQKASLEKKIEANNAELKKRQDHIDKMESYLEGARSYSQTFNTFRNLTQNHTSLNKLWDRILESKELTKEPSFLTTYLKQFSAELDIHLQIQDNEQKLEKMETYLDNYQSGKTNDGVSLRIKDLEQSLEDATTEIEALKKEHARLKRYRHKVKKYLEGVEYMDNTVEELVKARDELIRTYRSEEIEKVIRLDQEELAGMQAKRSQKQTLEGVIKDLEADERSLEIDFKAFNTLANVLSPTDGLIAEQLTGFIENFIAHVNQVLDAVWSYEFRVIPCGIENSDLDYKFPIMVRQEGEGNRTPDISKGSEAQVEILNFAFRLVTMTYLNLENYPLYIDELGRSFDELHRSNVMMFIKQLIESGNYSQLFMVSHYASEFGAFTQAETMVLNGTNISIPQRHNEQVTMQ